MSPRCPAPCPTVWPLIKLNSRSTSPVPALARAGIEVETDLHAGQSAKIDSDLLGQVLANLISNVEKYAVSGRWLGISSQQQGSEVIIRVSDRGPGVPKPFRSRLFQPFTRADDALTEGVSGAGIGLCLAQELVQLLEELKEAGVLEQQRISDSGH